MTKAQKRLALLFCHLSLGNILTSWLSAREYAHFPKCDTIALNFTLTDWYALTVLLERIDVFPKVSFKVQHAYVLPVLNFFHFTSKVFLSQLLWLLRSFPCSDLVHCAGMKVLAVRELPPTKVYLSYYIKKWPWRPLVTHRSRSALTFQPLLTQWNTNACIVNWRWKMIYEIIFLDLYTL